MAVIYWKSHTGVAIYYTICHLVWGPRDQVWIVQLLEFNSFLFLPSWPVQKLDTSIACFWLSERSCCVLLGKGGRTWLSPSCQTRQDALGEYPEVTATYKNLFNSSGTRAVLGWSTYLKAQPRTTAGELVPLYSSIQRHKLMPESANAIL